MWVSSWKRDTALERDGFLDLSGVAGALLRLYLILVTRAYLY
jgi:hypothetical protein